MNHMEMTRALRDDQQIHYNCCQSVLVTFAHEMGLTKEQAFALGANFGSGMRHGSACGALSAALMVLGMQECSPQDSSALINQFKAAHGVTDCASLLKASHERGEVRKGHCDGLVYEMVAAVEQILKERQS